MEIEEDGSLLKLQENNICIEIVNSFKNRFINSKERFAIPIFEGNCILLCYVEKITPVNIKSNLSYGIIQSIDDTDICCKPQN